MEEKTMKKKLILGILAAALSLTLAISGTLMLFTARSEVATNVVTLGNLDIELQEKGGTVDDYTPVDKVEFTGINFGTIQPNQEITKAPNVVHKGGVDAYLRVRAEVVVKLYNEETEEDDIVSWNLLSDSQKLYLTEMIQSAGMKTNDMHLGTEWSYIHGADEGEPIGYDSYTDENDFGKDVDKKSLKVFQAGVTTGDIFDTFVVPNWTLNDSDEEFDLDAFSQYKVGFILQAQAVQVDYNEGGNVADYSTWGDFFTELAAD
jgi:predicted ribosomally synthesized peptide with SipW-like signal peptide